jgi:hypothetical protein
MKSIDHDRKEQNFNLEDDQYAHIFVKYDERMTSLDQLKERIRLTRANILKIKKLNEGSKGEKYIQFTIDIQDVREVVLNLSCYPLISIEGFNPKPKSIIKGGNK